MAMPQPDSITWAVLLVEMLTTVPRLFKHLSIVRDAGKATAERPPPQKKNTDAELPRADIFVTYCGEGTEIVLNTAKAACVQDFPPSLFRVIVLDDSHSTCLENAIAALQKSSQHSNLYYASRNIHVSTHSKAANLNFGLSFASTLPGPKPDHVCVLDVDMIPSAPWLKTVLTSLLDHPTAALVCAPQRFYNIPPSDPLGMTHNLTQIECLLQMQNAAEEAWCTGSGFVVRRAALEQIGGFPEGQLQEDIQTSLLLSAAGWKTLYVQDAVQWGLAADTIASWIKQRQRWAAGVISICQFACSPQARQIPADVRLKAFMWGVLDTWDSTTWTLSMILLPLAVLTGQPLLPHHHFGLQLHLAVLDFVAQSMCNYFLSSFLDFRMSILEHLSAIWMAPLRLAIACRYIPLSVLGRPLPRFKPTGIPTTAGESELAARKKGTSCLSVVLWECGGWMQVLCLGVCLAGIGASVGEVVRVFGQANSEQDLRHSLRTAFEAFIVRIGWPPVSLLLMAMVKNAWIPIAYGISPPPLMETKEMLRQSEDTGVQYPTEMTMAQQTKRASQRFWWSVAFFHSAVVVLWHVRNSKWW